MSAKSPTALYRLCRPPVRAIVRGFWGLRGYGQRNVPECGGVLLLSNHQSYADPLLIAAPLARPLTFMARAPLFRNPLFGGLIRGLGAFPVEQGRADKAAIRSALSLLESGRAVVVFPEGTRTWDGEVQPLRGGFNVLVRRANVPVVPVAVHGAFESWPRTRLMPRPGRVRVMYGEVLPPEELRELSGPEAAERLRTEIRRLLGRLRRLP